MQLRPQFGPKLPLKGVLQSTLEAVFAQRPYVGGDLQDENFACCQSGLVGEAPADALRTVLLEELSNLVVGCRNLCLLRRWLQKITCGEQQLGLGVWRALCVQLSTSRSQRVASQRRPY